ncbi:sensor domain-containing diguanylate cyclase [Alteromonas halophila]|uniref:diguanylate cyclase n=1 Tax=Alteromonas halophila TaxID=516698 RepID=A0A918MXW7_9ALTE|nr:GGDEF domain-containing protein [Alteromonas halophila]GGW83621.1 hypothetical protein GCM10007391_16490 [Alteromonas halophila]
MFFRSLIVLIVTLCAMPDAYSSEQLTYEQERTRVLSMDAELRLQAVNEGLSFNTQTVLGKHFYNTVVMQTPGELSHFTIPQGALRTLRDTYPKYFLEHQILSNGLSQRSVVSRMQQLDELADQANTQQWPRLVRLATKRHVALLLSQGLYYRAIGRIRDVIPAGGEHTLSNPYDYSLDAIYHDLAMAYRNGGNLTQSLYYCNQLSQTLSFKAQSTALGDVCRSRTLTAQGNYTAALKTASEVLEFGREQQSGMLMAVANHAIAEAYFAMNNTALAEQFALSGLAGAERYPTLTEVPGAQLQLLLLQIAVAKADTDSAQRYLTQLRTSNKTPYAGINAAMLLQLEADIALLNNDTDQALTVYQQLQSQQRVVQDQQLQDTRVAGIDQPLQQQQNTLARIKQRNDTSRSRNLTILAMFTTTISIVCGIAVYRLYRHKTTIESFARLDQLTSVENRWFAMKAISHRLSHMDRANDKACVALLDIDRFKHINDRFGYETGDMLLAKIAKVLKYQLRREDVIGRYGGGEFILMLTGTALQDGLRKVDELRKAIEQQPMTDKDEDIALRFSCGLVEVSNSARFDDVIGVCDRLLTDAKKRGRNLTSYSELGPSHTADCA